MATCELGSGLRHFEDFRDGEVIELGSVSVSEAEIIEFGERYDPQTFHTDPVRARESPFGGLIASGWQSVVMLTRLWIDGVLSQSAGCGSPGVDEVRFLAPVRPGDVLRARAVVVEVRASRSRDWRGTLLTRIEGRNQRDELAVHFLTASFVRRRHRRAPEQELVAG